jgi:hypothetical protein
MPEYTHIRVLKETLAELERVKVSMRLADAMGLVELHKPDGTRVSLDTVIQRLIAFRARHAERARRSRARRRRPAAECTEPDASSDAHPLT